MAQFEKVNFKYSTKNKVFVAADKTTNYYKLQINEYTKLKENSTRRTYEKAIKI